MGEIIYKEMPESLPVEKDGITYNIPLGTVSHSTMRSEDVGPAIVDFLKSIKAPETESLDKELTRLLKITASQSLYTGSVFIPLRKTEVLNRFTPRSLLTVVKTGKKILSFLSMRSYGTL